MCFCSHQGSLWLGCLLVSFPRASLIPGNPGRMVYVLLPSLPSLPPISSCCFQNHLHSSPVYYFSPFPILHTILQRTGINIYKEKSISPRPPHPFLPFSLYLSYTHKHTEWMADFSSLLTLSCSRISNPRSLPKPNPSLKSNTEKERITFSSRR